VTKKRQFFVSIAIVAVLLLAGCAAGINPAVDVPDAGGKVRGSGWAYGTG